MHVHCVVGVTVETLGELGVAKCTTVQQTSTQIAKQNSLHTANIVQQPPHSLYCLHLTVWITLLYMTFYVVTPPHHNSTSLARLSQCFFQTRLPHPTPSLFYSEVPWGPHPLSPVTPTTKGWQCPQWKRLCGSAEVQDGCHTGKRTGRHTAAHNGSAIDGASGKQSWWCCWEWQLRHANKRKCL